LLEPLVTREMPYGKQGRLRPTCRATISTGLRAKAFRSAIGAPVALMHEIDHTTSRCSIRCEGAS
jgi:hypothetical protein